MISNILWAFSDIAAYCKYTACKKKMNRIQSTIESTESLPLGPQILPGRGETQEDRWPLCLLFWCWKSDLWMWWTECPQRTSSPWTRHWSSGLLLSGKSLHETNDGRHLKHLFVGHMTKCCMRQTMEDSYLQFSSICFQSAKFHMYVYVYLCLDALFLRLWYEWVNYVYFWRTWVLHLNVLRLRV